MTSWLAARYGMAWGTAREWVRVSHRARDLPWIAEAHASLPAEEGSALESAVARRAEDVSRCGGPGPRRGSVGRRPGRHGHGRTGAGHGRGPRGRDPERARAGPRALVGGNRRRPPPPLESIRRLACDGRIEWVPERGGRPVGIGRRDRRVPGSVGRVLRHRDGGRCRFPGCGRKRWLHATTWSTGPTAGRRTWTTWSCCATPTTG
jgi:hypothetical protein